MDLLAAVALLILHTVDGREVAINPTLVVTVTELRHGDPRFHEKAKCALTLNDGKFVTVMEDCETVKGRMK